MYKKYKNNVRFTLSLSSCFINIIFLLLLLSLSIAFVYNNIPQQAMAQISMQGHSSNLLTIKNSKLEILYTADWEKAYNDLKTDLKRISDTILTDITTNVSDISYQNMNSQNYTISYHRGGGQIPTMGETSCTLYTKSLQPQQAQEIRKMVDDAKFFDLPSNLLPKGGAADYIGYTITIQDEEGKHKYTVHTSEFTVPAELKTLIQYLNSLCKDKKSLGNNGDP